MTQMLSAEEMEIVIDDARFGDLETLTEIFSELPPQTLLTIKDASSVTPLHMAAANGHTEVVQYLLGLLSAEEAKAWSNAVNDSGNTALHWASLNGHLEVVKALCAVGADGFVKNARGHDAIYEAENNGKEDVENWFLERYAVEDDFEGTGEDVTFKEGVEIEEERTAAHAAEAAMVAERERTSPQEATGLEAATKQLEL